MSIPTEPAANIGRPSPLATPGARLAGRPRHPSPTLLVVGSAGRAQPAGVLLVTEQLLRQHAGLPAEHLGRSRLRTQAIEQNLPMANRLARRYAGRGEPLDDLTQVAALALVRAVDAYDPTRRNNFAAYAVPSILGALKRHFRDTTWGIQVPRSTQELARELVTAAEELTQRRRRTPTSAELAAHLHVAVDKVRAAISARHAYRPTSLNAPHPAGAGVDLIGIIGGSDPQYARVDDQLTLRQLLAALPLRERRILSMRFDEHMTQTQIAAEIGVSQMQVSRLLKRTLAELRRAIVAPTRD
ncbi:SigB/SigF/SigG family RNA polymerase sigma factor [Micromonospora sp. NPDC049559]|uniref:SigB/SigF/SigG family RNA polymerase sigma factor n=1 Tax=Micromonospora sp. NPDC049559 TaxID=3155923 RepID=UPI0034381078